MRVDTLDSFQKWCTIAPGGNSSLNGNLCRQCSTQHHFGVLMRRYSLRLFDMTCLKRLLDQKAFICRQAYQILWRMWFDLDL